MRKKNKGKIKKITIRCCYVAFFLVAGLSYVFMEEGKDTAALAGDYVANNPTTTVAAEVTVTPQISAPYKQEIIDKGDNIKEDDKQEDILTSQNKKVNINKADESVLSTLKGIGPSKAGKIVSYREEHGDFKKIEDIMNVPGIKDATFNGLKDDITVE